VGLSLIKLRTSERRSCGGPERAAADGRA